MLHIYIYDISSLRVNDLTLILLTWRKWWAPNNASKWEMGFNSAFKGLKERIDKSEVEWREMASFASVPPGGCLTAKHTARVGPPFLTSVTQITGCTGNNGYLLAWVRPQYFLQHLALKDGQRSVPVNVQPSATKLLKWDTHQRGPVRISTAISTVMTTVYRRFLTMRCLKRRQVCQHLFL